MKKFVYITNSKNVHYKKGQKFKKGDTIVSNPNFFQDGDLLVGKLTKVAVYGGLRVSSL